MVRFTGRAREAVVLAQDEVRALGHEEVGTEHLLLGLLREREGIAARALRSLEIEEEEVRARVVEAMGRTDAAPTGRIPFTPQAAQTLERALAEARRMKHDIIGTEHLRLALARFEESLATQITAALGVPGRRIRAEVLALLSGGRGAEPA